MVLCIIRKWISRPDAFLGVTKWEVEYKPISGRNQINTLSLGAMSISNIFHQVKVHLRQNQHLLLKNLAPFDKLRKYVKYTQDQCLFMKRLLSSAKWRVGNRWMPLHPTTDIHATFCFQFFFFNFSVQNDAILGEVLNFSLQPTWTRQVAYLFFFKYL